MARKCKVLYGDSCLQVENQVNAWLTENEGVEIISLHYQRAQNFGHNVLILYNDNPFTPQIPAYTPSWTPITKPHYEDPFYYKEPTCGAKPC